MFCRFQRIFDKSGISLATQWNFEDFNFSNIWTKQAKWTKQANFILFLCKKCSEKAVLAGHNHEFVTKYNEKILDW